MAKDDMHMIAYKVLSYLYSCLKLGDAPDEAVYSHDGTLFKIPESYWVAVMEELVAKGYIVGFKTQGTWGGPQIVVRNEPRITMDGVEYLQENSMMRKAANALKEAKDTIPFL